MSLGTRLRPRGCFDSISTRTVQEQTQKSHVTNIFAGPGESRYVYDHVQLRLLEFVLDGVIEYSMYLSRVYDKPEQRMKKASELIFGH